MRIIDCTLVFNEMNMMNTRLHELDDVVDVFVMAEALQTHTGKPKPLHCSINEHLFAKFLHKILRVCVDLSKVTPDPGKEADKRATAWKRENAQRHALVEALKMIHPIS